MNKKLTSVRVVIQFDGKETIINAQFTKKEFKRYKCLALDDVVNYAMQAEFCAIHKQNKGTPVAVEADPQP